MTKQNKKETRLEFPDLPVAFVISPIFGKRMDDIEELDTDLLVLTKLDHMYMGRGSARFDELLDGTISEHLRDAHMTGKKGDHQIFATTHNGIRSVLLIGLGTPGEFSRPTLCGLYRLILDTARERGIRKVTIPIFPDRLTDINLSGALAVLRCRVAETLHASGLGNLAEIELLCTPQARRYIEDGLNVSGTLCGTCFDHKITN